MFCAALRQSAPAPLLVDGCAGTRDRPRGQRAQARGQPLQLIEDRLAPQLVLQAERPQFTQHLFVGAAHRLGQRANQRQFVA